MTHKQRILRLLSDGKPHSHHELYQLGCVAHSRISDLRKDGHLIRQWRDGDLYMYQLEGSLNEASASGPGISSVALDSPSLAAGASLSAPSNPTDSLRGAAIPEHHDDGRDGGVLTLFGDAA